MNIDWVGFIRLHTTTLMIDPTSVGFSTPGTTPAHWNVENWCRICQVSGLFRVVLFLFIYSIIASWRRRERRHIYRL